MLRERGIEHNYREYTQEPLSTAELRTVLGQLGVGPADVLRKNDKVYKELGLSGDEPAATLIELMAKHPTLLQRPIAVLDGRAALGRPPEAILALVDA